MMVQLYINWCHWTDILFGSIQTKKYDQGQTFDITSPVLWDET